MRRNDSPGPIAEWCATFRFADYLHKPISPRLAGNGITESAACDPSPVTLAPGDLVLQLKTSTAVPAGSAGAFPVNITVAREHLPIQGMVVVSASTLAYPANTACSVPAKSIWRAITAAAPAISWPILTVLGVATTAAAIFLFVSILAAVYCWRMAWYWATHAKQAAKGRAANTGRNFAAEAKTGIAPPAWTVL